MYTYIYIYIHILLFGFCFGSASLSLPFVSPVFAQEAVEDFLQRL